jgi:hypothetical protein
VKKTQLLSWAIIACTACAGSDPEPGFMDGTYDSEWAPLAADEPYAGKTLAEWGVEYLRWRFSSTSCDLPMYDQDGSLCGLYQDSASAAFFFDYSPTKRLRTKCRVPAGKAIVVPIMSFSYDNVNVEPPLSDDELFERTNEVLETMRDLKLRVDGKTVDDISERKIEPTKHDYTVPPAPNWFSCIGTHGVEGVTISPSYFSGYVAVFPPPEPGIHELQYAGVVSLEGDEYAVDTRTRFVVED